MIRSDAVWHKSFFVSRSISINHWQPEGGNVLRCRRGCLCSNIPSFATLRRCETNQLNGICLYNFSVCYVFLFPIESISTPPFHQTNLSDSLGHFVVDETS